MHVHVHVHMYAVCPSLVSQIHLIDNVLDLEIVKDKALAEHNLHCYILYNNIIVNVQVEIE